MTRASPGKVKVFLSWSGERSKQVALTLKHYLPLLCHNLEPWMSERDLVMGERWSNGIGSKLKQHQAGIICVTPENQTAPWLLFEAGALSKQMDEASVIPLLLGISKEEISGPLREFQSAVVSKADMRRVVKDLNALAKTSAVPEQTIDATFKVHWPAILKDVTRASQIKIAGSPLNVSNVVSSFSKFGFPEPDIGNHIFFSSGFESHTLFQCAFELTKHRLWIWGRKNRKVFDKNYYDFFEQLARRRQDGFDFRLLFLHPASEPAVLSKAHRDADFHQQLLDSIISAREMCDRSGVKFEEVARFYKGDRTSEMVVVDDAVMHSRVQYDSSNAAIQMTKASFSVVGAESAVGKGLLQEFSECWNSSVPA